MKLNILPVGKFERKILIEAKNALNEIFKINAEILKPIEIFSEAYNSFRSQYSSTKIIEILSKKIKNKTLAITNFDLYANKLNFVFGEAQFLGKVAIVSFARLDPRFYGESFEENLFFLRLKKEVVHEVGHLLGLMHCKNKKCVMRFSNSIFEVDEKNINLCSFCKLKLEKNEGKNLGRRID